MTKTYLDSGVLIVAFRADNEMSSRAIQVLDDGQREFVASPFFKLETLPKAQYHKQLYEVEFYETYFSAVNHWVNDLDIILQGAEVIASQYGLAAMDALHVAAALSIEADELITTERSTKPMFRVPDIKVVSLFPEP